MKIIILFVSILLGINSSSYAVSLSDIAYRALSKKSSNGSVPSEDAMNHVEVINVSKTFRGNLVFLDSLENVTDDFEETLERKNPIFIRMIDRFGSTQKVIFENEILYTPFQLTTTNLESVKPSCSSIDMPFSKIHGDTLYGALEDSSEIKFVNIDTCKVISTLEVDKNPTYISLSTLDDGFKALLIKTNPLHEFRKKKIDPDLIYVLNPSYKVDGILKIQNKYYSPRLDIAAAFPTNRVSKTKARSFSSLLKKIFRKEVE